MCKRVLCGRDHRSRLQRYRSSAWLDRYSIEMYASLMCRLFFVCILLTGAILTRAESPNYFVFVSNERSDDITVMDGASQEVVATFRVGKRPRGIHAALDGNRVFVTL